MKKIDNHILKRSPIDLLLKIIWMLLGGLWVITEYKERSFFFWGWLLIFLVYLISIVTHFLYPEMVIKKGEVSFFQHKRQLWRRVSLPISNIEKVWKSERKAPGIGEKLLVPTFIFVMKDGTKHEYFPAERPGKRLRKIMDFLHNIPGMPPIVSEKDDD